ncbi:Alpha/Beta hydrolase protein [Gongronella butleri]|nr:Alpha/Beta hydrolase protein [Gongronella butleri]
MSYFPKIHPDYKPVIDGFTSFITANNVDVGNLDAETARAICHPIPPNHGCVIPETLVEEKKIQAAGHEISLYIVRPLGTENKVLPATVFVHGGGYVFFQFKNYERFVKDLAVKSNMAVVYVEYTLTPEVKYPVPLEESLEAVIWVHEHAKSLNIDADKIAIGGDSAGSNATNAIAVLLKERGLGDVLKGIFHVYPDYDPTDRSEDESYSLLGRGDFGFKADQMNFSSKLYYPDYPHMPEDVRVSTKYATDEQLKGLPPTLVLTAETDMYRGPGEKHIQRLQAAGVDVVAFRVLGAIHGYLPYYINSRMYKQTVGLIASFLNDLY